MIGTEWCFKKLLHNLYYLIISIILSILIVRNREHLHKACDASLLVATSSRKLLFALPLELAENVSLFVKHIFPFWDLENAIFFIWFKLTNLTCKICIELFEHVLLILMLIRRSFVFPYLIFLCNRALNNTSFLISLHNNTST